MGTHISRKAAMWARQGRLRCAAAAILIAFVAASAGDLAEDDYLNLPANLAPEVKELALEDLVDVTPSGKVAHATPKGKPKSHAKPAKKKGEHRAKKKAALPLKKSTAEPRASKAKKEKKNKAGKMSHGKKSPKPSAASGAATDKKAKQDYGAKVAAQNQAKGAKSQAKGAKSSGNVKKEGKGEASSKAYNTKAPTRLGDGQGKDNIVAIRTANAAQENATQQRAFAERAKADNILGKDALNADRLRNSYKKKMKEHAVKAMEKLKKYKVKMAKKIKTTKARLATESMRKAGRYVARKTQAAAIKFATMDVVAKRIKHASKKLVKGRDKVAIAKKKIADKKAKDKASDMVKASMLAAKKKLQGKPEQGSQAKKDARAAKAAKPVTVE